jgi:hypothetical protein
MKELLLLKDKMNTVTGKKKLRKTSLYGGFLAQFYTEWDGEK